MGKAARNRTYRTKVRTTGVRVHVSAEQALTRLSNLPDQVPGQHCWGIAAWWRVSPSTYLAGEVLLDTENLVTVCGLGCLWCEQQFTEELADQPCAGG